MQKRIAAFWKPSEQLAPMKTIRQYSSLQPSQAASKNRHLSWVNFQPVEAKQQMNSNIAFQQVRFYRKGWYRTNARKRINKHSYKKRIISNQKGLEMAWRRLIKGRWYFGKTHYNY